MAERYSRNSISDAEQDSLQKSVVAVIGCGGLGGRTAELLTRLGVGTLILTDPDIFSESNLNRQIFCNTETLGQEKTLVVAAELQKINPELRITPLVQSFDSASIKNADIVVDGLDSGKARKQLASLCRQLQIPLVHGAVDSWYGQLGIDQNSSPLIDTLFSDKNSAGEPPNVMAMTVAVIAAMQAAEVCKYILGRRSPLMKNVVLQCDLLRCEYEKINDLETS